MVDLCAFFKYWINYSIGSHYIYILYIYIPSLYFDLYFIYNLLTIVLIFLIMFILYQFIRNCIIFSIAAIENLS
jgi:hypothetical protein